MGEMRNAYKILVGKPEGRRHSEDLNVDGIIINVEIGFEGADWIYLAQDRDRWQVLVTMVMNLRVP
jgi:hypothetical protein